MCTGTILDLVMPGKRKQSESDEEEQEEEYAHLVSDDDSASDTELEEMEPKRRALCKNKTVERRKVKPTAKPDLDKIEDPKPNKIEDPKPKVRKKVLNELQKERRRIRRRALSLVKRQTEDPSA